MRGLVAIILSGALVSGPALAGTMIDSGRERVTLVELYTSEGCSSCPPADRQLSRLVDEPELWRGFVPVAFHVDYWDDLGWRDRFGDQRFSKRQRRYASHWGNNTVYTPSFVINGERRRGSTSERGPTTQPGQLRAEWSQGEVTVRFSPEDRQFRGGKAYAALLGFGLRTKVTAGENRDRTLHHDFVALRYARTALEHIASNSYKAHLSLGLPEAGNRNALAVWVSNRNELTPLQAAGGWLAEKND